MTKELEDWLQEECEEVRAEERAEREKEHVKYIHSIMKSANVSAEKAMEMLAIDKKLWPKYLAMLSNQVR